MIKHRALEKGTRKPHATDATDAGTALSGGYDDEFRQPRLRLARRHDGVAGVCFWAVTVSLFLMKCGRQNTSTAQVREGVLEWQMALRAFF